MKNVMTIAWEIARAAAAETGKKASLFFREALRMAWAEVKAAKAATLPELTGSEKQIKWANSIRKNALVSIKYLQNFVAQANDATTNAANKANFEKIIKALDAVKQQKQAAWWIDNGKMAHDFEESDMLLPKLANATVMANPTHKLVAAWQALKQHGFIA